VWEFCVGPGQNGKTVALRFNTPGNKLGCACSNGRLHVFTIGVVRGACPSPPFMILNTSMQIKPLHDFHFLKSSGSLIAAAGGNRADLCVCVWDTLLPAATGFRHSFSCHPDAKATCLAYVPGRDILVSGGSKGKMYAFDLTSMTSTGTVDHAHTRVDTLAYDERTDVLVSGGLEGDIKLWSPDRRLQILHRFPHVCESRSISRHPGNPGLFSNKAITRVYFQSGNLYACTAEGSVIYFGRRDIATDAHHHHQQNKRGSLAH